MGSIGRNTNYSILLIIAHYLDLVEALFCPEKADMVSWPTGKVSSFNRINLLMKPLKSIYQTHQSVYSGASFSNELLEMEYEPEAKSTSSIAQSTPLSQRRVIPKSRVSGMLKDPLKAGW